LFFLVFLSFLLDGSIHQAKKGSTAKSTSAVIVSDGDQTDYDSDTGSVIYVKAKSKAKDPVPKDTPTKDLTAKDPTIGEATDAMAVDEPTKVCLAFYTRQLDRQLGLIERMITFLQLDSGLAVPKAPNNSGEYLALAYFLSF
jgi:hypothetical protein